MKYLILLIFLTAKLAATPISHELKIGENSLTYYLDIPDSDSYPLLLVLEGSFVEEVGPRSILGLHKVLAQPLLESGIGLVFMEKRGVGKDHVDVALFHRFNTVSQRINDHLQLIQHLKSHPPQNWNGQLVILGGSEGGPIAIKLAHAAHPAACVVLAGCGDQPFAEFIWHVIETIAPEDRHLANLPIDRTSYEAQIKTMKAEPDSTRFWFGQSYFFWADALDQTEYQEFLSLKCPAFVVSGSEDIDCVSTDRLIAMAKKNHQNVTYLRVEGMGHKVLDPQWGVLEQIIKWLGTHLFCSGNYTPEAGTLSIPNGEPVVIEVTANSFL